MFGRVPRAYGVTTVRNPGARPSVLSAKNVKQVALPNRTRLQGGEHATGTPEGRADSD